MLRPGNVHSAHEWREILEPVVAQYRDRSLESYFRGDGAFANSEIYHFLEEESYLQIYFTWYFRAFAFEGIHSRYEQS